MRTVAGPAVGCRVAWPVLSADLAFINVPASAEGVLASAVWFLEFRPSFLTEKYEFFIEFHKILRILWILNTPFLAEHP